jgi:hypothetical protein
MKKKTPYVILDVFSRYVTGWMVAPRESAELAKRLIEDSCAKQNTQPGQLTVHADRGSAMTSKPAAFLMADPGVTKTHGRPYVSDDNPYSESQFRTLKYRPEFPDRLSSIQDARAFCLRFFPWHNDEHRHSALGLMTPAMVHYGQALLIRQQRQAVLDAAYQAHPERYVRKAPRAPELQQEVWINKPPDSEEESHSTPWRGVSKSLTRAGFAGLTTLPNATSIAFRKVGASCPVLSQRPGLFVSVPLMSIFAPVSSANMELRSSCVSSRSRFWRCCWSIPLRS